MKTQVLWIFFATHEIDEPVFAPNILAIGYDNPQPVMDESIPDAEPGNEPGDDAIMESEDSEYDVGQKGSEDYSDDDNDVVPIERHSFSLDMRFSNASKFREFIIRGFFFFFFNKYTHHTVWYIYESGFEAC